MSMLIIANPVPETLLVLSVSDLVKMIKECAWMSDHMKELDIGNHAAQQLDSNQILTTVEVYFVISRFFKPLKYKGIFKKKSSVQALAQRDWNAANDR